MRRAEHRSDAADFVKRSNLIVQRLRGGVQLSNALASHQHDGEPHCDVGSDASSRNQQEDSNRRVAELVQFAKGGPSVSELPSIASSSIGSDAGSANGIPLRNPALTTRRSRRRGSVTSSHSNTDDTFTNASAFDDRGERQAELLESIEHLKQRLKSRHDAVDSVTKCFNRIERRRRYAGLASFQPGGGGGGGAAHAVSRASGLTVSTGDASSGARRVSIVSPAGGGGGGGSDTTPQSRTSDTASAALLPPINTGAALGGGQTPPLLQSAMKKQSVGPAPPAAPKSVVIGKAQLKAATGVTFGSPRSIGSPRARSPAAAFSSNRGGGAGRDSTSSIDDHDGEEGGGGGTAFGGMLEAIKRVKSRTSADRPDSLKSKAQLSRSLSSKSIGTTVNTLVVMCRLKSKFRNLRSTRISRLLNLTQQSTAAAAARPKEAGAAGHKGSAAVQSEQTMSALAAKQAHRQIMRAANHGPTFLRFNPSPAAQLTYGSIIALESLDGWFLTLNPVNGVISVREPTSGWFAAGKMPFEPVWQQGCVLEAPKFLFRVLNLLDPLDIGPVRYTDAVWIQLIEGRGEDNWRSGAVLAPYVHSATSLDDSAVDIAGNPVGWTQAQEADDASAASCGNGKLTSAEFAEARKLKEASADRGLFGLPRGRRRSSVTSVPDSLAGVTACADGPLAAAGGGADDAMPLPPIPTRHDVRLLHSREGLRSTVEADAAMGGRRHQHRQQRLASRAGTPNRGFSASASGRRRSRSATPGREGGGSRTTEMGFPPSTLSRTSRNSTPSGAVGYRDRTWRDEPPDGDEDSARLRTRDSEEADLTHRVETTSAYMERMQRESLSNARINPLDYVGSQAGVPRPMRAHVPLAGSRLDYVSGPRNSWNPQGHYRRNDAGYAAMYQRANARPITMAQWRFRIARKELTSDGFVIGGLGVEAHSAAAATIGRGSAGGSVMAATGSTASHGGAATSDGIGGASDYLLRKDVSVLDVETSASSNRMQTILANKIEKARRQRARAGGGDEEEAKPAAVGDSRHQQSPADGESLPIICNLSEIFLEQQWMYLSSSAATERGELPHRVKVEVAQKADALASASASSTADCADVSSALHDATGLAADANPGSSRHGASEHDGGSRAEGDADGSTTEPGSRRNADDDKDAAAAVAAPSASVGHLSPGDPGRALDSHFYVKQSDDGLTGGNRRPTHLQAHAEGLLGKYKVNLKAVFRIRLLQTNGSNSDGSVNREDKLTMKASSQLRDTEKRRLGRDATHLLQNVDESARGSVRPVRSDRSAVFNLAHTLRTDVAQLESASNSHYFAHENAKASDLDGYYSRRLSLSDAGDGIYALPSIFSESASASRRGSIDSSFSGIESSSAAPDRFMKPAAGALTSQPRHGCPAAHLQASSRNSSAAEGILSAIAFRSDSMRDDTRAVVSLQQAAQRDPGWKMTQRRLNMMGLASPSSASSSGTRGRRDDSQLCRLCRGFSGASVYGVDLCAACLDVTAQIRREPQVPATDYDQQTGFSSSSPSARLRHPHSAPPPADTFFITGLNVDDEAASSPPAEAAASLLPPGAVLPAPFSNGPAAGAFQQLLADEVASMAAAFAASAAVTRERA